MGVCKISQIKLTGQNNQLTYEQPKLPVQTGQQKHKNEDYKQFLLNDDKSCLQDQKRQNRQQNSKKIKIITNNCQEQKQMKQKPDNTVKYPQKNKFQKIVQSKKQNYENLTTLKNQNTQIQQKTKKDGENVHLQTIKKNRVSIQQQKGISVLEKQNIPHKFCQQQTTAPTINTFKKVKKDSTVCISGDFLKIKQKQAISQYKVLSKITNKQIGQLYKVLDKTTNQLRSLQIIKQDPKNQKTLHQINILKKLDHPHILHLYDVFIKKGFYYIVGEYIQGDNILCLTKNNDAIISEKKLSKIILEILQALNYLHFKGIMHRNIKPETIVFQSKIRNHKDEFPAVKLINFKNAADIQFIKQKVGNTYFSAPEVHMGGHNQKCDIWSVGVILYLTYLKPDSKFKMETYDRD